MEDRFPISRVTLKTLYWDSDLTDCLKNLDKIGYESYFLCLHEADGREAYRLLYRCYWGGKQKFLYVQDATRDRNNPCDFLGTRITSAQLNQVDNQSSDNSHFLVLT